MKQYTYKEWIKEAQKRFGMNPSNWKFVCAHCGHIQTPEDFEKIGKDKNLAYCECIGRHIKGTGCDWCSYGFLASLGNGVKILDGDKVVEIFDFAEGAENE